MQVDGVPAEEPVGTADSVITEVNEVPDNAVLRKLLVWVYDILFCLGQNPLKS